MLMSVAKISTAAGAEEREGSTEQPEHRHVGVAGLLAAALIVLVTLIGAGCAGDDESVGEVGNEDDGGSASDGASDGNAEGQSDYELRLYSTGSSAQEVQRGRPLPTWVSDANYIHAIRDTGTWGLEVNNEGTTRSPASIVTIVSRNELVEDQSFEIPELGPGTVSWDAFFVVDIAAAEESGLAVDVTATVLAEDGETILDTLELAPEIRYGDPAIDNVTPLDQWAAVGEMATFEIRVENRGAASVTEAQTVKVTLLALDDANAWNEVGSAEGQIPPLSPGWLEVVQVDIRAPNAATMNVLAEFVLDDDEPWRDPELNNNRVVGSSFKTAAGPEIVSFSIIELRQRGATIAWEVLCRPSAWCDVELDKLDRSSSGEGPKGLTGSERVSREAGGRTFRLIAIRERGGEVTRDLHVPEQEQAALLTLWWFSVNDLRSQLNPCFTHSVPATSSDEANALIRALFPPPQYKTEAITASQGSTAC